MTLILGRKQGMTHVFREDGTLIGVTVVSAGPCTVTQVRTQERDGYDAVQLGYADTTEKRSFHQGRLRAEAPAARGAPEGSRRAQDR